MMSYSVRSLEFFFFFFSNQHNSLETHQVFKYIDVHCFSLLIIISCPDCTTVGRTIFPLKGIFFFFFLSVFGYLAAVKIHVQIFVLAYIFHYCGIIVPE